MKINIIALGKIKQNEPYASLISEYQKRLGTQVKTIELEAKKLENPEDLKNAEGDLIEKNLAPNSSIIILDERGENLTSHKFAKLLENISANNKTPCFVVGGAFGLSDKIKAKASHTICFGTLTWAHKLVRAMLFEQLYRASTILSGHPYHK